MELFALLPWVAAEFCGSTNPPAPATCSSLSLVLLLPAFLALTLAAAFLSVVSLARSPKLSLFNGAPRKYVKYIKIYLYPQNISKRGGPIRCDIIIIIIIKFAAICSRKTREPPAPQILHLARNIPQPARPAPTALLGLLPRNHAFRYRYDTYLPLDPRPARAVYICAVAD